MVLAVVYPSQATELLPSSNELGFDGLLLIVILQGKGLEVRHVLRAFEGRHGETRPCLTEMVSVMTDLFNGKSPFFVWREVHGLEFEDLGRAICFGIHQVARTEDHPHVDIIYRGKNA